MNSAKVQAVRSQCKARTYAWMWMAIIGLGCVITLVTFTLYGSSYDDAYITYRYAYRLATGAGFNFNSGETLLGTTAPGYALLLGLLGLLHPQSIPAMSGWINGLSLLAIDLAILLYSARRGHLLAGFISALIFTICPLVLNTFGGEMLPVVALILWAFVVYAQDRWVLAGVLCGLATFVRGDAGLAILLLGFHYLVTHRKIPWALSGGFAATLIGWVGYSWVRYGSPLPNTLAVKIAQGQSGHWGTFLGGLIDLLRMTFSLINRVDLIRHPIWAVVAFFALSGIVVILKRARYCLLPITWIILHALAYEVMQVAFYHWYALPSALGLAILCGYGAAGWLSRLSGRGAQNKGKYWHRMIDGLSSVSIGAMLVLLLYLWAVLLANRRLAIQQSSAYPEIGRWLARSSAIQATIGAVEIGEIGFFSDRTIIDPMGLVTDGAITHIKDWDLSWAYREMLPDYIVVNHQFDQFLGPFQQETWFSNCYHEVTTQMGIEVYQRCQELNPQDRVIIDTTMRANDKPTGLLTPGNAVGQTFRAERAGLRSIGLLFGTYGGKPMGRLVFRLQDISKGGQAIDLVMQEIDASTVQDNQWTIFSFSPLPDSEDKEYFVSLEARESISGKGLALWTNSNDFYPYGQLHLNQQPAEGDLSLLLYYTDPGD